MSYHGWDPHQKKKRLKSPNRLADGLQHPLPAIAWGKWGMVPWQPWQPFNKDTICED